ncbi:protein GFS12 isoform X1 [Amborella trichopoda]|uniref:BEACH domain-containing protein n=1 Tax=Amborella trichopoda TaxID=13333 RepID=W1P4P8_AMBTC|nr:protein GFS12 isoform X1 [Amborella trichopoda]ERN01930.1 hypothetical protein AMTR_s00045p00031750 [Amborella trichopoda]|eukprot:XP_020520452.1 protein GFS12 isoform X1 [Amborella trichopoda]
MEDTVIMCLDCWQQRMDSIFQTERVLVSYLHPHPHSPLPFSSRAVCQIQLTERVDKTSSKEDTAEIILVAVANHEGQCLRKYIGGQVSVIVEGNKFGNDRKDLPRDSCCCLNHNGGALGVVGCQNPNINYCDRLLYLKNIATLGPIANVGTASYAAIKHLVCNFLSSSIENKTLESLNLLLEGKPTREAAEFLHLVGIPDFGESITSGCVRHPNIVPNLGLLKIDGYSFMLYPKAPYTLENILHYSPGALKSDWHIRFLMYQVLSALVHMHSSGVAHGALDPLSIMLKDSCWCWLSLSDGRCLKSHLLHSGGEEELVGSLSVKVTCCMPHCSCEAMYSDLKLSSSIDWTSDFKRWWKGELTNYEYLLTLNRLSGRRWGDCTFHTVMPWVMDFSVRPDEHSHSGWRDLQKSKWRLAKGDEQLDFTYLTSEVPHHVSDECLSELAVCSYKARRLPLSVLRCAVRSVYEPNEYPATMQRLYQWTPDECIPEFYSDPRIFQSIHSEMSDLAVPSWASSPEEFIELHRAALESDRVSQKIHHWIDLTFGYKLSGEAAIAAKNVTLPTSEPTMPRATGRRQLFSEPHPMRLHSSWRNTHYHHKQEMNTACEIRENGSKTNFKAIEEAEDVNHRGIDYLEALEAAASFCEHFRNLNPCYTVHPQGSIENICEQSTKARAESVVVQAPVHESSCIGLNGLLEYFESEDDDEKGFQELLMWKKKSSCQGSYSEDMSGDIFSMGCILAELHLKQPLFDPISLTMYKEHGSLPGLLQKLPPHVQVLVESSLERDWKRRPSAKSFLESPYFPPTVRTVYQFLAPLQFMASLGSRLQYAAKLAREGALRLMGSFAAEMSVSHCLPLIVDTSSDSEAELAFYLLKEFMKCLRPPAVKTLILPAIQNILQTTEYSHLKVALLQNSFVRDIWKQLGKQAYLEKIHPSVISNLYMLPHKNTASAASVLLIGSCEELGVPISIHQTIMPLVRCFGKGLAADGIDALIRIGGLLGEKFVVRQLLPILRSIASSCIALAYMDKPEPVQSWSSLALIDCLATLDGLIAILTRDAVISELFQDEVCLHVKVLMQKHLDLVVLQVAANALVAVCQRIGLDATALHILPQLKELFDELAFSPEISHGPGSQGLKANVVKSKSDEEAQIVSRSDLVLLLYPPLASLLGIEKLRQCCTTWLLLEQFLSRHYSWKWEHAGETCGTGLKNLYAQRPLLSNIPPSEYNPAKLLLNGVGWSIPQSQLMRTGKNSLNHKQLEDLQSVGGPEVLTSSHKREPWFWFPGSTDIWEGSDFANRAGNLKDELPWKIKASVLHSVRAHAGTLRALAVDGDECTVYSGGVGTGFKGIVRKWELPEIDSISGYFGHEEIVNGICILSASQRVASCDGTIHIWNSQNSKLIKVFSELELSTVSSHSSFSSTVSKVNTEHGTGINAAPLSGGILSNAFNGTLYTCMHYLESDDMLVAGTGCGSLRFIDVAQDRKLHLWKCEAFESSFASIVSSICYCGSDKWQAGTSSSSSSWIAAGFSSGHCRLLDIRSGNLVALWRAHDGFITKLAAPEDHLLVSSSLDRKICIWDLRRNWSAPLRVIRGHSDGISGFSIWGQDMISVSGNKIGISSLSKSSDEQQIFPQKLYAADRSTKNMSALSSICVLPFSRLFLVGSEDGHLKTCC